jgi:hypothetical protein
MSCIGGLVEAGGTFFISTRKLDRANMALDDPRREDKSWRGVPL